MFENQSLTNQRYLMDGAMGTYFNLLHPEAGEAEEANITHPDWIVAIHKEYILAGASVIRTNTFAVNHLLFPERKICRQVLKAAIANARQAVKETGDSVEIMASIGPVRQDLPYTDEDILEEYRMLIDTFLEEGISCFALETFSEPKWGRELAAYIKTQRPNSFVLVDFSVNVSGYTKFGFPMQGIVNEFANEDCPADAFGFNCGVGGVHLKKLLKKIQFPRECIFAALPNAGYQHELRGRINYSDNPVYYARQMEEIMGLGVNLVGGCCGTTPDHIKELSRILLAEKQADKKPEKQLGGSMPVTVGAVKANAFLDKLHSNKEKVFVVELDSPFEKDAEKFYRGAFQLKEQGVDIVTVSDSPMARARADASLMAVSMKQKVDIPVMPHISCRDRNLIGLRSEILGAYINGVRDFLLITGDPVAREDRGSITGVFDVNSIRLMEYVKNMNSELFYDNPVSYGGALNYSGVNVDAIVHRMEQKIAQGCSYFLTQPIFSKEDIERIKLLKSRVDTKIICGIMPLVSYKNALFMHNEMPGIHVPDEVLSMYHEDMERREAEEVAVHVSVDIAKSLNETADGFYLMTPFGRVSLVNQIIDNIRKSCETMK